MIPPPENNFEDLMRLAGVFRQAKVFLVACELDLFAYLQERPKRAEELAADLHLDARALGIFLDALAALGFLQKDNGAYVNSPAASRYLVPGRPDYRANILRHLHHCWDDWSDLLKILQQGHPDPGAPEKGFLSEEADNRDFIWGMDNIARDRAPRVLEHLDLTGVERLLDVGSGAATYSIAFAQKYPNLRPTLFDLPLSLSVAQENVRRHGLEGVVRPQAGDFYKDDLGRDYDLIWISQVLHGQDEDTCKFLLRKVYTALKPGGRVVIHEFFLDEARTQPLKSAIFSVHMLVVSEGGRTYTPGEMGRWLAEIGFQRIKATRVPEDTVLVEGVKG